MRFNAVDKRKMEAIADLLMVGVPDLSVYLGEMEVATSSDTTHVTVSNTVRKVMSVWLESDSNYTGTNYYADPQAQNFTSATITLDSALPSATTDLNVAYYSDCATCGWDSIRREARDSNCATCGGLGMTLSEGTAQLVPVKRMRSGMLAERMGLTGIEAAGLVILKAKEQYENMIKAALKMTFEGNELVTFGSDVGDFQIRRLYNAGGESTMIRILTRYERDQGG